MLAGIWLIDRLLPSHIPATILYGIPLVFIAYRLTPRSVVIWSVILLFLHMVENYLLRVPLFDWLFLIIKKGSPSI